MTGLISAGPAGHLGAPTFNRIRQIFVTGLLTVYVLVTGAWRELDSANVGPLLLSGLIGIFIGDTLLFATLNRLGPRRSGILFALNAPIAALLGWVVLGEALSASAMAAWMLLWAVAFMAIALFATPARRASVVLRNGYKAWVESRRQAAEDQRTWNAALQDARMMADLSRAMTSSATQDIGNKYY